MKKIIIELIVIFTLLFLVFKYNYIIRQNTILISIEFVKNIIPSLFPLLIISSYIKENIVNKTNNHIIRFICLSLSFMPANAIISNNDKELLFSSNVNPLFSYIIIKNIINTKVALIIVFTNLLINYILLYLTFNKQNVSYVHDNQAGIIDIIKSSSVTITYIYGTIITCNIIFTILKNFIHEKFLVFIEITNGFRIINNFSSLKIPTIIFLNSFGGISFFMQIKSIKTNINFKFLLKKLILSLFVLTLTLLILMSYHII